MIEVHLEACGSEWEGVHVHAISGREAIGEPFSFDVDVACDPGLELPEDVIPGGLVTIVLSSDGEDLRRIHGVLGPIRDRLDPAAERRAHRLRVVPRASRLALVEAQEIFVDQTVPEVIARKLERHGFGPRDFELRLLGKAYPKRELVVQYGESDLAFVLRLAEHLGIAVFFCHREGVDRMIFTDHPAGFRAVAGAEETRFCARREASGVFALEATTHPVPTTYVVQDYNYRRPLLDLTAHHTLEEGSGGGMIEYGGHAKTPEEAGELARIRAEERLCRRRVYEGRSACAAFSAGHRTTLVEHPHLAGPEDLLFVAVEHTATFPRFDGAGDATYANAFEAVPAGGGYRPPRRTPRPRISGLVTGVVQSGLGGGSGGIARVDEHGRYTVEFHFDPAIGDRKTSPPVRMAQPFAGPGQGMHFPLRPGTEVAVAFVNGDPDRPVIVGALANAHAPSPVTARNSNRNRIATASGAVLEISEKR